MVKTKGTNKKRAHIQEEEEKPTYKMVRVDIVYKYVRVHCRENW